MSESPPARVSRGQRLAEERLFNPLFRRLLRSRFHWPASRWLVVVAYEGRHSGRRYAFPAAYLRRGDAVVVVTPGSETTWWRNFRTPRECTVWLRGTPRPATGAVVAGDRRAPLLRAYLGARPLLARLLGVASGDPAAADLRVVEFRP